MSLTALGAPQVSSTFDRDFEFHKDSTTWLAADVKPLSKDLPESLCKSADFTNRFPPVRNQGAMPLCAAFATAALVEEQNFLKNGGPPKALSPIDSIGCTWSLGETEYGNWGLDPHDAMKCALDQKGLCEESKAPFQLAKGQFECVFTFKPQPCLYEKIRNTYTNTLRCEDSGFKVRASNFKQVRKFAEDLTWYLGNSISTTEVMQEIEKGKPWPEFSKSIRIPKACRDSRLSIPDNLKVTTYEGREREKGDSTRAILRAFQLGVSSSVSVDVQKYFKAVGIKAPTSDSLHQLVVNGMRFRNGRCEFHMRNSWGEGAPLNGWVEAKTVLENISYVHHFEARK